MARDVEGLVSVMRALLVPYMYELDPNSVPILFQNEVYESKRPLRIGYYTYDGFIQAVPAMVRGVEVAKAALEKQGHTVSGIFFICFMF
jgi:fatty acid amide hydrolase